MCLYPHIAGDGVTVLVHSGYAYAGLGIIQRFFIVHKCLRQYGLHLFNRLVVVELERNIEPAHTPLGDVDDDLVRQLAIGHDDCAVICCGDDGVEYLYGAYGAFLSLGYDVIAFIGIYLEKSSLYDNVAKELRKIPEIVRLNYTTGNYSMFAEIVCKDINQLRFVLHDELQKIKGIERTETFISLEESFGRNVQVSEEQA